MDNPESATASHNTAIIVGVVVILVLVCLAVPVCAIAGLTLMGPSVGNVFSNIVTAIAVTPTP